MNPLFKRRIIVGISGGIAAYKAAELVRLLRRQSAEVRVIMTAAAAQFITPLTLQALSGHPVRGEMFDREAEAAMGHIELARWGDRIVIAPATADCLAQLAQGQANNLLSAVCLASSAPLLVAPAMNQAMWQHRATVDNLKLLRQRGIEVMGPDDGEQACGDIGPGRMLEPQQIVATLADSFQPGLLNGINTVVTAGPTWEAIDPVRYLGNRSSGRMGYALAEAAINAGADVTLISGPTHLEAPDKCRCIPVRSAEQMFEAVQAHTGNCQLLIAAAAVADYRPQTYSKQKIAKSSSELTLQLTRTPDILSWVASQNPRPFIVGFAAQSGQPDAKAQQKLQDKKLDMICANDISRSDIGFETEQNELSIIDEHSSETLPKASKTLLAEKIVALVATKMAGAVT